jgi:MFS family permease
VLTREIFAPAIVVVLGPIMTILDATIVNVALPVLGQDLHTSIPVIQWVPTIYLLAFAAVIPLTGWTAAGARSAQRLDVPGAVLLPGGLALFLYGLAEAGQHAQWTAPAALGPMTAGAAAVVWFVRHAVRVPDPLIDVRLFRHRGFAAGTAVNFVLGTALFGVALLLPLYFEILRGPARCRPG